jgi:hypothetical protein
VLDFNPFHSLLALVEAMAGDSDLSKAADKGKGKAVDDKKPEEVKKDKDGKPIPNGKKDDDKTDGLFSCPC